MRNNKKEFTAQNMNITNILLGIITLFLAFLCIDQKYSYMKNNERQEKLYSLLEWHTTFVEVEFLKSEGRRLAFANHLMWQNPDIDGNTENLLSLGESGIKAYISLPENSRKILSGIESCASSSEVSTPHLMKNGYSYYLRKFRERYIGSKGGDELEKPKEALEEKRGFPPEVEKTLKELEQMAREVNEAMYRDKNNVTKANHFYI